MPRQDRDLNCSLFIRNIAEGADHQELREVFDKCGTIKDVYIPRDFHTKKQLNIAYIQFENEEDAEKAINELQGVRFMDAELSIEIAKGRRKNPDQMKYRERRGDDRRRGDFGRDRRESEYRYDRDDRGRHMREDQDRGNPRKRHHDDFVGGGRPRDMGYPDRFESSYGERYSNRDRYEKPEPRYREMTGKPYRNQGREYGYMDSRPRFNDDYERNEPRNGEFYGRPERRNYEFNREYEPHHGFHESKHGRQYDRPVSRNDERREFRGTDYVRSDSRFDDRSRNEPRFGRPGYRRERPHARNGDDRGDQRRANNSSFHDELDSTRPEEPRGRSPSAKRTKLMEEGEM